MTITISGPITLSGSLALRNETTPPAPTQRFVAIAQNSDAAAVSTDGTTWTSVTLPSSQNWNTVVYGNGVFVALSGLYSGGDSDVVATSTDGVTWTQGTMPSSRPWVDVAWGANTFVAIAWGTNVMATSPDGVTWTQRTVANGSYRSITFALNQFLVLGGEINSQNAWTSPDGVTWTARTVNAGGFYQFTGAAAGPFGSPLQDEFLATAKGGSGLTTRGVVSTDNGVGAAWTTTNLSIVQTWYSITYSSDLDTFVAVGDNVTNFCDNGTSFNGTNTEIGWWRKVIYANGRFLAVGQADGGGATTNAIASTDGSTWTTVTLPASAQWISVAYG